MRSVNSCHPTANMYKVCSSLSVKRIVAANVAQTGAPIIDQETVALGRHEIRVSVDITGGIEPR